MVILKLEKHFLVWIYGYSYEKYVYWDVSDFKALLLLREKFQKQVANWEHVHDERVTDAEQTKQTKTV